MHLKNLLIPLFLLIWACAVELKTSKTIDSLSVGQKEFKQYAKENWENFGKEVQKVNTWLTHYHAQSRADEVIQVLLYISRLDEPIYVGVELLKAIDKSGTLLERTQKIAKKTANADAVAAASVTTGIITEGQEQHGTERVAVAFMIGTNGVMPLHAKVRPDEETMEEQLEMGKMIVHIVKTAKEHRTHRKRRLFHKIVGEVFAETGLKKAAKWSKDMSARITRWDKEVNDRLLSLKKVAIGLKDVALWLTSPENVSGVVQLLLYFTNLGAPIKISMEIISALGLDETFTKLATKMGVKLTEFGVNQRVAMWAFGPNGVVPLFVRQGVKVDEAEVMDAIERTSLWYYYKKERNANHLTIRCNMKIENGENGKRKCEWKVKQQKLGRNNKNGEQIEEGEVVTKQMEEHMKSKHPAKYEQKQRAQREKEIIRRSDIWNYFQKDEKLGIVKCNIKHKKTVKMEEKCNWKIGTEKANESELNDHLSLEHLAEFEQRLKAMGEKELPEVRHVHGDPLANSLTLFQRVTMSLVLYKGKPMDQMVDIVIARLHNWERRLVKKWKRRWERIKRIQFRDVYEAFKYAAMWLITPRHINSVIKVLFIITMLDTPIYLAVEILKAFGIQRYLFKKLDKASMALKKNYEGTILEKSLQFMIGEGGMVRLILEGEKSELSMTGSAELLHTVIMTVVHNPGEHAHTLAFTAMEQLRELRLELSLVRGWNNCWPTIRERYQKIEEKFNSERVKKIGENVRLNGTASSSSNKSKLKQIAEEEQQQKHQAEYENESSDVSVEIFPSSPSGKSEVSLDFTIISIESGKSSVASNSSEYSVVFDNDANDAFWSDEHSVEIEHIEHVDDQWDDCDDSFVAIEYVDNLPNEIPNPKGKEKIGDEPTTMAKAKKKNGKGCNPIAKMWKNILKSPKRPNGSSNSSKTNGAAEKEQQKQKQNMAKAEEQEQKQKEQQKTQSAVGGSFADYRDSDESVPSVIVGSEEKSDCPNGMEENVSKIQFYELLLRSDNHKCRTVQILGQKFEVVQNFLDEAIRKIVNADSEGAIPPVINLRLGNEIWWKKQKILESNLVRPVSVMFLYYKMGQAGIYFDCDALSARPLEYAFTGPKGKQFILLLPNCAGKSGKISEFAIFKADYFGEIVFDIPIEGDND